MVLDIEKDAEQILCLGDLVDYGPQPVECVHWAMKQAPVAWLIQGNHDYGVARNEDPRCSPPYRHLTKVTRRHCIQALSTEQKKFLGDLQPLRSFEISGAKYVACHAAPSDPLFRYLRTHGNDDKLKAEIEIAGNPDFLFFGHTHWPLKIRSGKTLVVNPGSVGQPKDGDPRAAYAVWDDGEVTLRRAEYDIDEAVRAYADTPLEAEDIAALSNVLRTGGSLPCVISAKD